MYLYFYHIETSSGKKMSSSFEFEEINSNDKYSKAVNGISERHGIDNDDFFVVSISLLGSTTDAN